MKVYVKYMVSLRCKMVVLAALETLGLKHGVVELGEVDVYPELSESNRQALATALSHSGLELMDDTRAILVERIKQVVIEMVHYAEDQPKVNFSCHLSDKLGLNYTYMSNLFSEVKGITIEHYIVAHKIERAKELMLYDELNMTEIALKLHYGSVTHFCNQFKKATGLSPSFFKELRKRRTQNLEDVGGERTDP